MKPASDSNQLIKQAIALRAKYRLGQGDAPTYKTLAPALVVPHFRNRGGDPVKSLRTRQLSGIIANDGCDSTEACSNAVAVAEAEQGSALSQRSFQKRFEVDVQADPDMVAQPHGINASAGSLAHGHLNCMMRNMLAGKKGCECQEGDSECKCANKPILNKSGYYCMDLVAKHDKAWSDLCFQGIPWEMLDSRIDTEEPDGALIISLALNKKNEAGMKTSHTEIMKTLVGLCKPGPQGEVPFEPVRDKMIGYYGSAVDHPDFFHAFQLVLDAGGHQSPFMADMHEFTVVHVNPKLRKMRFEAYGVVAPYPLAYPRLKNASLKWAWKQPTVRGWCPLPPSIAHRLNPKSKQAMTDLMDEVEDSFRHLSRAISTVVDEAASKKKTTWIGEVEIGVMSKIFAVPRQEESLSVKQQETKLKTDLVSFVTAKIQKVLGDDTGKLAHFSPPEDNDLLKLCWDKLHKKTTEVGENAVVAAKDAPLVPKVIEYDTSGNPISTHEEVHRKNVWVEVIPWRLWPATQEKDIKFSNAKSSLIIGASLLRSQAPLPDIAITRQGNKVVCKATKDLNVGDLVVPLDFKKPGCMVMQGDASTAHHPHEVDVVVSWPVTEDEKAKGIEDDHHSETISVQPDFKLPAKKEEGKPLQWTLSDAPYPFWGIKRQTAETQTQTANCTLKYKDIIVVVASGPDKEPTTQKSLENVQATTFSVRMPMIVNCSPIKADEEMVLKWTKSGKEDKVKKARTWVDNVATSEKKRHKSRR